MFETWKAKRADSALEKIRARDADLGVPSTDTLHDRLWKAATSGMWNVVEDCLQKGSTVNETLNLSKYRIGGNYYRPYTKVESDTGSSRGAPLLCVAAMQNDVKAAEMLLARGANPSMGYSGRENYCSPLFIAARFGYGEMAQLLCDKGADLSNQQPLRVAEKKGHSAVIKIIRAAEAQRGQGKPLPDAAPPVTPAEKVMDAFAKLSDEDRAKLLAAVNEKFAPPKPGDAELAQGIVVQKPLTLKRQA